MYMPAQIQLQTVKMVEIEPESDVHSPGLGAKIDSSVMSSLSAQRSSRCSVSSAEPERDNN